MLLYFWYFYLVLILNIFNKPKFIKNGNRMHLILRFRDWRFIGSSLREVSCFSIFGIFISYLFLIYPVVIG